MATIHYRRARPEDAGAIARVHAESWRVAYRGALRDAFLDGDIVRDRMIVWTERLSAPPANQLVVIAEDDQGVVGFACAYGRDDERWGTLLDNLHVRGGRQKLGVGTHLMSEVALWCAANYSGGGLYLWVLEPNDRARRFYERLGAADVGGDLWVPPGGGAVKRRRYFWSGETLMLLRAPAAVQSPR